MSVVSFLGILGHSAPVRLGCCLALAALCATAYADPQATRSDIEIRRILSVAQGTIRIAKGSTRRRALYLAAGRRD